MVATGTAGSGFDVRFVLGAPVAEDLFDQLADGLELDVAGNAQDRTVRPQAAVVLVGDRFGRDGRQMFQGAVGG
jgi:hypothetical protein